MGIYGGVNVKFVEGTANFIYFIAFAEGATNLSILLTFTGGAANLIQIPKKRKHFMI